MDISNTIINQDEQEARSLRKEQAWIAAARTGDDQAIGSLFEHYGNRLFKMIYLMIQNFHDAEDLTQQTIIKAINGLKKYSEEGQFHSWLYQIARNETLNYLKNRKRYKEVLNSLPETDQLEDISFRKIVENEELELLSKALQQLQQKEREVMILRLYQGLKFREISEITGDSLNTVLGRMRRAVHQLKEILNDQKNKDKEYKP